MNIYRYIAWYSSFVNDVNRIVSPPPPPPLLNQRPRSPTLTHQTHQSLHLIYTLPLTPFTTVKEAT